MDCVVNRTVISHHTITSGHGIWPPPAASPSLCNLLQVAYRTVLPRRAVARSRRRLCGLPHPGTLGTRQPPRSLRLQKTPRPRVRPAARGWARPGRGGAGGRGGDATARGRAGERAGAQRLLRCGGRRAAPVRSARTVPGVGRGAQAETQRTGRPLLRHFLPARGFRREREARKKDHSFPRLGEKIWNVVYH